MNNNKLFKNRFSKERVARFFDREGFYIVLFLCVCIVGVTAVWVSKNGSKVKEPENIMQISDDKAAAEAPPVQETSVNKTSEEKPKVPEVETSKTPTSQPTSPANDKSSEKKETSSTTSKSSTVSASIKLGSPFKDGVKAEDIVFDYSPEDLVCFKAVDEWRAHLGVDVKAAEGTEVLAVYGGKVLEVRNGDESADGLGWAVVVDHGNGYRAVYANLDSKVAVKKNQVIKKGQKIGSVGNTSILEKEPSGDSPAVSHLHFELLKKNGKSYENVDPKKYFSVDTQ